MTKYVLTYHGESADFPDDPAEIEKTMNAWGAWYGSIGASLVDGGAPFSTQAGIGVDGGDIAPQSSVTGYTVIDVASLDAAKTIAKACPVLESGSTVQISECVEM